MTDLSNRRTVKKVEKDAKIRDRQDAITLKGIMGTMAGRQWIFRKLVGCHVFATSFSANALMMAFAEGQRDRGLELLNDIMAHCPDQYVLMMREANARDSAAERRVGEDGDGGVEGSTDPADDDNGDENDGNSPAVGQDIYNEFDRLERQGKPS